MQFINNKIVIIGAGNVGSATLSSLLNLGLVSEIVLIDINKEKAEGEVLDVSHTTSFTYSPNLSVRTGDYCDCEDAEIIVITAGPSVDNPNQDRTELASKNSSVIKNIMKSITSYTREAVIIVVTNPLDIATYVAQKSSGYPIHKVIGTGTLLDTARFRKAVSKHYGIDAKNVHGYVLGEHGSTAFATWSLVNIAGMPLDIYDQITDNVNPLDKDKIIDETKKIGFQIVSKKGSTNFGVAGAVQRLVKSILLNERSILPVSSVLNGEYGLQNVALSIPCVISSRGIEKTVPVVLTEDEMIQLHSSAGFIKNILEEIKA